MRASDVLLSVLIMVVFFSSNIWTSRSITRKNKRQLGSV